MSGIVKERPILFSAPMVQAIIAGRKTQTRRIFKDTAEDFDDDGHPLVRFKDDKLHRAMCPFGKPGQRLWVRETHGINKHTGEVVYKADGGWADVPGYQVQVCEKGKWRPSIHMKRAHSRILLEIVAVRVERLNEISERDAAAEGYASDGDESAKIWFSMLWERINGKASWDANPWVWVVEFKRIEA